jgi:serine/threonine-protein kinase
MAIVYLARDLKHDRLVALKVMRPELSVSLGGERFLREISIAAKLSHPHILPLYDSGDADGLLYYVMPFVEGESLRDLLDRENQLPLEDAVRITREVADALSQAHSYGVIHRDIKPENIMLTGGHAIVADFGIARAFSAAGGDSLTQTGMAVGTPAYMSPEQASGDSNLDGRTDVYALGCVLYEMLVGQVPFTGPNAQAIMARHTMDMVTPPSIMRQSVPEELENVLLRALEKSPADRFRTAGDFSEALVTLDSGTYTPRRTTRAMTMQSQVQAQQRRRRVTTVAASAVGVIGIGLAAFLLWPRADQPVIGGLDLSRVAVLYFEDFSPDGDLGYLADGLTEGLIDQLSSVRTLDVISRNGVEPYRGGYLSVDSVARILDAGNVIAGSVDWRGARLHVTVRLIDGNSGADIDRSSLEVEESELLTVRDSIVNQVSHFLRPRLGEEIRTRKRRDATSSVEAWSLVQQAERERKRSGERLRDGDAEGGIAGLLQADSILAAAESVDRDWLEPIVLRAQIAVQLVRSLEGQEDEPQAREWVDVAVDHADRVLAEDANEARALEARGAARYYYWLQHQPANRAEADSIFAAAQSDLEQATRADPSLASAHVVLSDVYLWAGDETSAMIEARRGYEEDAYLENVEQVLIGLYRSAYGLKEFAQARDWCDEGGRRFPGSVFFAQCQIWLMTTDLLEPDVDRAWQLAADVERLSSESRRAYNRSYAQVTVGGVLARAGLADSARSVLLAARADPEVDPTRSLLYIEAYMRVLLGEEDDAIDLMKLYFAANPAEDHGGGEDEELFWWWEDLQHHPRFSELER